MTVRKILEGKSPKVSTIEPDAVVTRAILRMVSGDIGSLVVSDDEFEVLGVISERDIVRALESHGERMLGMDVRSLMSTDAPVCALDDRASHVMAEMTRSRHRHLPVVDHGRLVGIVSIGDLVKYRLEQMQMENNVLRDLYIAKH